jgi:hypothetical protein
MINISTNFLWVEAKKPVEEPKTELERGYEGPCFRDRYEDRHERDRAGRKEDSRSRYE